MACPYQYHARYLLRLARLDEVQELIDKADYGSMVHAALTQFHRARPRVSELEPEAAAQALTMFVDAAFAAAVRANYLARAWLVRFKPMIPQYLDWQRQREAGGWRFRVGEAGRELHIETPHGRAFKLIGRIDRVDTRDDVVSVIDYKTQSETVLKNKLKTPGEDVQLPVYALLWGGPVAAALFLSLTHEGIRDVPLAENLDTLADEARTRLAELFDALHEGAALPAQGAEAVCSYCDMEGLCRRSHWS